jgi:hypothetical protein
LIATQYWVLSQISDTADVLRDSINTKVSYRDSTTTFVTPTQLTDSLNPLRFTKAWGDFQGGSLTVALDSGVWTKIRTGTYLENVRASGFTLSADTIIVTNGGVCAIDFGMMGYDSTVASGGCQFSSRLTVNGTEMNCGNYGKPKTGVIHQTYLPINLGKEVQLELTAGDKILLEMINLESDDDFIITNSWITFNRIDINQP